MNDQRRLRLCKCISYGCGDSDHSDRSRQTARGVYLSDTTWVVHQQADHRLKILNQLGDSSLMESNELGGPLSRVSSRSSSLPVTPSSSRPPSPSRNPPSLEGRSPEPGPSRVQVTHPTIESSSAPSGTSSAVTQEEMDQTDVYDTSEQEPWILREIKCR